MNMPRDLRYTKTHEWARMAEGLIIVGITDFAQEQLSDLTYVELPAVGDKVMAEDETAVVESVKAASDVYAPVDGTIAEVNEGTVKNPDIVNSDPYGAGWLFKIKPENPDDIEMLLDADQYQELLPDTPDV
jgi:glycine cleavage system H protein